MRIITERELIRNVAKQWREQYQQYDKGFRIRGINKTVEEIHAEFDALDRDTILYCDKCGRRCQQVVRFDIDDDYGSVYELCDKCLLDALMLINGFTPSCIKEE